MMKFDYKEVLRALGEYTQYIDRSFYKIESLDRLRIEVEGYYLLDTVTEERFLDICDELDNELYDDYADMYEPGSVLYGIPLEHYIYDLQRITGKRPKTIRHWMHLKVEAQEA